MADPTKSAEQQARDMMERMGVPDAQSYSAGDLVELANLIALSQPAPEPPTENDLLVLVAEELGYEPRLQVGPQEVFGTTEEMVGLLRVALARWGQAHPAPEPTRSPTESPLPSP